MTVATRRAELEALRATHQTLLTELAEEARRFIELLAAERGEQVSADLFGSVAHLGAHASLLVESLEREAELADDLEEDRRA